MSTANGHSDKPSTDDDAPISRDLMQVAEAVIFAADNPVSPGRIADIVAEVTGQAAPTEDTVREAVEQLNDLYAEQERAFEIHEWGGGYRMATRTELSPFVKALFGQEQEKSLSRSLMETLAILAYRQPVTRPEVDFIRGVNSDYAIRKLLELGLADVKGRSDSLGRPLLYGTTTRFLDQFGLNSLDDLPTLREIEELLDEPHFDEERAQLLALKGDGASINGEEPPEIAPNGSEASGNPEDS